MNVNPIALEAELTKLPSKIRDQEKIVIEKKEALDLAKLTLEVATSQAMLNSTRPNATEKKAQAIVATETEKKALIEAQTVHDKEQAGLSYLTNRFISLRKISSLEIELVKANISGN